MSVGGLQNDCGSQMDSSGSQFIGACDTVVLAKIDVVKRRWFHMQNLTDENIVEYLGSLLHCGTVYWCYSVSQLNTCIRKQNNFLFVIFYLKYWTKPKETLLSRRKKSFRCNCMLQQRQDQFSHYATDILKSV